MISGISLHELESGNANIKLSGDMIDTLPDNLNLLGLTLENCCSLKYLPENLNVKYLSIQGCPELNHIPAKLNLSHLYIFESDIATIPECSNWIELVLINCHNLRKLPDSCTTVVRDLYLEGCIKLTELPAIKFIGGNLDITRTSISNLPEGIMIGESLYAIESKLKSLPKGIKVGKDIILNNCKELNNLPNGLIVNGNLDLSESNICQLPEDLIVKGNLDIQKTRIQPQIHI